MSSLTHCTLHSMMSTEVLKENSDKNMNNSDQHITGNKLQAASLDTNYNQDYISPFDDDIENELKDLPSISSDELPIFSIQSISPTSRSLSPIDNISLLHFLSPCVSPDYNEAIDDMKGVALFDDDDRVSLEEVNAKIGSSPADAIREKKSNLETIFEGVFLETPPKKPQTSWRLNSIAPQSNMVNRFVQELQSSECENDDFTNPVLLSDDETQNKSCLLKSMRSLDLNQQSISS